MPVLERMLSLRNLALEPSRLDMCSFIRSVSQEMIGSQKMLKSRNLALEPPRLEIITFIRGGNREMIGSWKDAQIEKSNPRAPKARNEHFHKER